MYTLSLYVEQHEEACSEMVRVHDKKLKELEADWKAQIDKTVAELENTHKAKCATLEEEFNVKYQLLVDKYDSVSVS